MEQDKVYIEDYVVTYLSQLTRIKKGDCFAALFGIRKEEDKQRSCMIYGAIGVPYTKDSKQLLSDEIINHIIEKKRNHFAGLFFLGWAFLYADFHNGNMEPPTQECLISAFGRPVLIMIQDGIDKERRFYTYHDAKPVLLPEYHIFYERNGAMQSYLIDWHEENETGLPENPENTTTDFCRASLEERKSNRVHAMMVNGSMALVLLLLISVTCIGILTMNQYQKMQAVEATLSMMSEHVPKEVVGPLEPESVADNTEYLGESPESSSTDDSDSIPEKLTLVTQPLEQMAEEDPLPEENVDSAMGSIEYVVVKGDTLNSISKNFYGSIGYVDNICAINGIQDKNEIFYGQKIILP